MDISSPSRRLGGMGKDLQEISKETAGRGRKGFFRGLAGKFQIQWMMWMGHRRWRRFFRGLAGKEGLLEMKTARSSQS